MKSSNTKSVKSAKSSKSVAPKSAPKSAPVVTPEDDTLTELDESNLEWFSTIRFDLSEISATTLLKLREHFSENPLEIGEDEASFSVKYQRPFPNSILLSLDELVTLITEQNFQQNVIKATNVANILMSFVKGEASVWLEPCRILFEMDDEEYTNPIAFAGGRHRIASILLALHLSGYTLDDVVSSVFVAIRPDWASEDYGEAQSVLLDNSTRSMTASEKGWLHSQRYISDLSTMSSEEAFHAFINAINDKHLVYSVAFSQYATLLLQEQGADDLPDMTVNTITSILKTTATTLKSSLKGVFKKLLDNERLLELASDAIENLGAAIDVSQRSTDEKYRNNLARQATQIGKVLGVALAEAFQEQMADEAEQIREEQAQAKAERLAASRAAKAAEKAAANNKGTAPKAKAGKATKSVKPTVVEEEEADDEDEEDVEVVEVEEPTPAKKVTVTKKATSGKPPRVSAKL